MAKKAKSGVGRKKSTRKPQNRKAPQAANVRGLGGIKDGIEAILNQFGVSLTRDRFFTVYDNDAGVSTFPTVAVAKREQKFTFTSVSTKPADLNAQIFEALDGTDPPQLPAFDSKKGPVAVVVRVRQKPAVFTGMMVTTARADRKLKIAILGDPEIIILP